jgi:hypothetical protein
MGGTYSTHGERRSAYRVLVGKPGERDYLEVPGIGRRIILRWFFRKWDGEVWAGLLWLMKWTESSNEPSGSINCGEFLDYLRSCKRLRMESATWSFELRIIQDQRPPDVSRIFD